MLFSWQTRHLAQTRQGEAGRGGTGPQACVDVAGVARSSAGHERSTAVDVRGGGSVAAVRQPRKGMPGCLAGHGRGGTLVGAAPLRSPARMLCGTGHQYTTMLRKGFRTAVRSPGRTIWLSASAVPWTLIWRMTRCGGASNPFEDFITSWQAFREDIRPTSQRHRLDDSPWPTGNREGGHKHRTTN